MRLLLAFENIILNRSTCELSSDKASIRLANKEYQKLEMFMSNSRQIISSDRFMEKIWGFDSDTEQNVVWVYISYLRKKLAKVGANVQIKAARNMGYSLEAKND
jgi:two-component system response regulator ArlR